MVSVSAQIAMTDPPPYHAPFPISDRLARLTSYGYGLTVSNRAGSDTGSEPFPA